MVPAYAAFVMGASASPASTNAVKLRREYYRSSNSDDSYTTAYRF
jgi:hypothetical protein